MERKHIFDALIISGIFIFGLMVTKIASENGVENIPEDSFGILLIPINIFLIGLVFKLQLIINPIKEETKETKKERATRNRIENEEILKKYDSMEHIK